MKRAHLVLPALFFVGLLAAVPVWILVVLSMLRLDSYELSPVLSLRSWFELLGRPFYLLLIGKAVFYGATTALLAAFVAYPIAFSLLRLKARWKAVAVTALLSPLYVGEIVRIYAWRLILGGQGLVNYMLHVAGLTQEPILWLLFSPFATFIVLLYNNLPLLVIVLWIALERIDRSLLEVARDLGARPVQVFVRVVLPLTAPGLAAGFLIVYALAAGDILTPRYMGGPSGGTALDMLDNLFGAAFDWPMGAALSLALLFALSLPPLLMAFFFARKASL